MNTIKIDECRTESGKPAKLIYVGDDAEGIVRRRRGSGFVYYYKSEKVTDSKTLQRIKKLAIPPAWSEVWISPFPNGHLQATGYDSKNRKQYKYHELWTEMTSRNKFDHLYDFGKRLPRLRARLRKDMRKRRYTREKVLAIAISVMDKTYVRIGSADYKKLYGSYGITTFQNRHVKISGSSIRFSFQGKKGKRQEVTLRSKRLANSIKQCREIPGRVLFQYYDEKGERKPIDSGMVNAYIAEAAGNGFTAKDFRTWAGSLQMLTALKSVGNDVENKNKALVEALDTVSRKLGNTRAVCRKYYVHPEIIEMYECDKLDKYLQHLERPDNKTPDLLSKEEKVLLKLLKTCNGTS